MSQWFLSADRTFARKNQKAGRRCCLFIAVACRTSPFAQSARKRDRRPDSAKSQSEAHGGIMRKNEPKATKSKAIGSAPIAVALLLATSALWLPVAMAVETAPSAPPFATSEFALEPDAKDHESERKEIEGVLGHIEESWNNHSLDNVMGYYADEYINNDGLDKKAVSNLTQDFWKTYPDARSFSKVKQVRIEGNFATVESRDMASGSTAKEMPGIGTKGDLKSISEGQLYMKKVGTNWKIIGDRIDYEKVRVAFGMAKDLNATFSAPEQVKSGHSYSAKLELALPPNLTAVGSITSQPLEYPQPQPTDQWRPLDGPVLERILPANLNNRNELLMATIGITDSARSSLKGIEFLTRRLNVVPSNEDREKADKTAIRDNKEKLSEKAEEKARQSDDSNLPKEPPMPGTKPQAPDADSK